MMDDFLHNLRTGKNKPFDRNRKQFDSNGYKNPDRQGPNDNRRKDAFQRSPPVDLFPAIKKLLADFTDGQRRLAEIDDRRAIAEERIASALENIASGFFEKYRAAPTGGSETQTEGNSLLVPEIASTVCVSRATTSADSGKDKSDAAAGVVKSVGDRKSVLDLIGELRKEQFSYEKIARTLEAQGIPTFSGKGAWHSQTVSKICHQYHPSLTQTG